MTIKEKNVLIVGGCGFIGSNLAKECIDRGANVTIFDSLDPNLNANLANLEDIGLIRVVKGDTRNFSEISREIKDRDIIFNCAGQTSHSLSMKDPYLDLDVNCRGTLNILEALRQFNIKARVVYIGTSTQTGKMQYSPLDEKHPEFPLDIYSAHKVIAEKYHFIYHKMYDVKATVLRCPNCYGPRAPIGSREYGFLHYFIGLALQNKQLTLFGEGNQKRNIIYVRDLVNALIKISQADNTIGETYFIGGERQYSLKEVAHTIVRLFGGSIKNAEWPEDKKRMEIGDVEISSDKLKGAINWEPRYTLEKGLKETKDYFCDRLDKYLLKI